MNIKKYLKPVALGLLLFSSCNEDILEKTNPNQLSTETFFTTEAQLRSAVDAAYAALQGNNMFNREFFFLHDMLSDENLDNSTLEPPRKAALDYTFNSTNKLVVESWQGLYRIIHRTNLVIANAEKVPPAEITDETRERLVAEARFLRGWAYFELVSLWGGVPLITEPATIEDAQNGVPRATEEEVYEVIFADLDFAEANLPVKSAYDDANLGRATKGAAQALEGKIRMWRAEYQLAITEFQKVISSGEYSIEGVPYIDNFTEENENNAESIFEVQFTSAHGDGGGWAADGAGIANITFRGQEYSPRGWANVFPNQNLRDSYYENDPRYEATVYEVGDAYFNGTAVLNDFDQRTPVSGGFTWRKYTMAYKQESENSNSGINFRVIRYADVLLMMAEAQLEVNGVAAALPYLNQVRERVDLPAIQASDVSGPDELFDLIVRERRIEFAGEQIRNRDIRRWRRHDKLDSEPIKGYRDIHNLLPLPDSEIANNAALTQADQNPGYN